VTKEYTEFAEWYLKTFSGLNKFLNTYFKRNKCTYLYLYIVQCISSCAGALVAGVVETLFTILDQYQRKVHVSQRVLQLSLRYLDLR
jgi:hypothetical protein